MKLTIMTSLNIGKLPTTSRKFFDDISLIYGITKDKQ